jgi:hypothetical protein
VGNGCLVQNAKENAVAIGRESGYNGSATANVSIGAYAARDRSGANCTSVGYYAGFQSNQGAVSIGNVNNFLQSSTTANNQISIGYAANQQNQGSLSIGIGAVACNANSAANSITVNATGISITANNAAFYVAPIRNLAGTLQLTYDTSTKEVSYFTRPYSYITNYQAGVYSIPGGGWTIIAFPNNVATAGITKSSNTLIIQTAGIYKITLSVNVEAAVAAGEINTIIQKNAAFVTDSMTAKYIGLNQPDQITSEVIVSCVANDVISALWDCYPYPLSVDIWRNSLTVTLV